jgi:hypothetical protein
MAGCLLSPVRCRLTEASALRDCRFRFVISLLSVPAVLRSVAPRYNNLPLVVWSLVHERCTESQVLEIRVEFVFERRELQSVEKFEVSSARGLL